MASLHAAATLMQPAKLVQLRKPSAAPCGISKSFGVSCSLQTEVKDFAQRCADAAKIAGFALATSALVASVRKKNSRFSFLRVFMLLFFFYLDLDLCSDYFTSDDMLS